MYVRMMDVRTKSCAVALYGDCAVARLAVHGFDLEKHRPRPGQGRPWRRLGHRVQRNEFDTKAVLLLCPCCKMEQLLRPLSIACCFPRTESVIDKISRLQLQNNCPSEARTHDLPIISRTNLTVGRCNQLSHGALQIATCKLAIISSFIAAIF